MIITGRDGEGRLWTSPLYGAPGFLQADGESLHVAAGPDAVDPLHDLPTGQQVGLLAIDLATRRRFRVNIPTRSCASCWAWTKPILAG